MNEQPDEILLTVKVSEEQLERDAAKALQTIERIKKSKRELELENKKGTITQNEYRQSFVALAQAAAEADHEYKASTKTLADYNRVQKSNADSIKQQRAKLSLLTAGYAKLSKSERESAEVKNGVLKAMQALTEEVKDLEAAYKNSERSIDSYDDSLKDQQKLLSSLVDSYESLTEADRKRADVGGVLLKRINDLKDAQEKENKVIENSRKGVKDYLRDLTPFGIRIGDVADSFKNGAQGAGTFAKAINTTRGGLIALTAVPIVLVLTAVVAFFTRSKEGADLLERKLSALTAVFDFLLSGVVDIGKGIVHAFEAPGEALDKFGEKFKENLLNRVTAYKTIVEGLEKKDITKIFSGFFQMFTGVKDLPSKLSGVASGINQAAIAGEAVAATYQRIASEERKLDVDRAKAQANIEQLKKTSDDVTLSIEKRKQAAKEANALEVALLEREQKLQEDKIANIKKENALRPESKEGLEKLAEAQKKYYELERDTATRRTEIGNKINELTIQGEKDKAQAALTESEKVLNAAIESGKKNNLELLTLQEDYLRKKLALDLAGVIKGSAQEKEILANHLKEMQKLRSDGTLGEYDRIQRIEIGELKDRLAKEKAGSEAAFAIRQGIRQRERNLEITAAQATIKNKEELAKKVLEIEANYAKDSAIIEQERIANALKQQQAEIEKRIAQAKEGTKERLKAEKELRDNAVEQELNDLEKSEAKKDAIKEQHAEDEAKRERQELQDRVDRIAEAAQAVTSAGNSFIDASIAAQTRALDEQQAAALSSAALSAEEREKIEANFQKKRAKLEKEAAEQRRRIASIENVINTAQAVTKAYAVGGPLGAIFAAFAVAQGIAQQVIIDNQKFEMGGHVRGDGPVFGPSHAQGGIKMFNRRGRYVGEMEGDEIILTKGVYRNPRLRAQASALNVAGGGKAFAGLNSAQKVYDTTNLRANYSLGGVNVNADTSAITAAVLEGFKLANISVAVVDINNGQAKMAKAQAQGDI